VIYGAVFTEEVDMENEIVSYASDGTEHLTGLL